MENLTFLEALKLLKEKGHGFRMHRAASPGVLCWLASDNLETSFPIKFDDYFGADWNVIQDDTVIR